MSHSSDILPAPLTLPPPITKHHSDTPATIASFETHHTTIPRPFKTTPFTLSRTASLPQQIPPHQSPPASNIAFIPHPYTTQCRYTTLHHPDTPSCHTTLPHHTITLTHQPHYHNTQNPHIPPNTTLHHTTPHHSPPLTPHYATPRPSAPYSSGGRLERGESS